MHEFNKKDRLTSVAIGTFVTGFVHFGLLISMMYNTPDKITCLDKTPMTHWTESSGIGINSSTLLVTMEDCGVMFVGSFGTVPVGRKTRLWYPTNSSCDSRTHVETTEPVDYNTSQNYKKCIQQTHKIIRLINEYIQCIVIFAAMSMLSALASCCLAIPVE